MVSATRFAKEMVMEKSAGDLVADAVAHYEQTKLAMLEIEAKVMAAKSNWLSNGIGTDAASRVADDAKLMAARVENQKAKMKLATLKSIAKKIKNDNMTCILVQHLIDSGQKHVVDSAHERSIQALEESGFMKAYES